MSSRSRHLSATFSLTQLHGLRKQLHGRALVPGDDGYDAGRRTWNVTTFDQQPAIVVLPVNAADVVRAVACAREHNLSIAVQGGGHGHPRPADGALLVNFADMAGVRVTPAGGGSSGGTARVEARVPSGESPEITIRQLLTHTPGLDYRFQQPPDGPYARANVSDGFDQSGLSLQDNIRRIARAPLVQRPGLAWRYSVALDVLGAVMARAAGKSLQEIVAERVTRPLGMADTAFAMPA